MLSCYHGNSVLYRIWRIYIGNSVMADKMNCYQRRKTLKNPLKMISNSKTHVHCHLTWIAIVTGSRKYCVTYKPLPVYLYSIWLNGMSELINMAKMLCILTAREPQTQLVYHRKTVGALQSSNNDFLCGLPSAICCNDIWVCLYFAMAILGAETILKTIQQFLHDHSVCQMFCQLD